MVWHSGPVSETKKSENRDQPIALSAYRANLARGQRARRTDELFASADPPAAIRALPPDEFFYIVHEMGFPEAMEILVHGTAEQIQAVLDFSVWEGDRVSLEKSDELLSALVEAPPETLGRWAQGIDVELLAILLRRRLRIYDLSLEEEPDEPAGVLWNSPDRLFAIDIGGDSEQGQVTQHLVDSLYRYSPVMMRRLLVGVRAESDAEMEETAFRWRSGRMADLGFIDFSEALAVYQEIDPASVRIDQAPAKDAREPDAPNIHLRLPTAMVERLTGKTPFARAVAGLRTREEAALAHQALVALCNRVLSADRVEPSDDEAIKTVLERVSATLDLAIEFLARGEDERAVTAIRNLPMVTLHRLGSSLVGKLRKAALTLVRENPFAVLRPALDIFEPEDAEVLASLTRARPLFPRCLDEPPTPGRRPFACLADLAHATRAVERAAAAVELLVGLGVRPQDLSPHALEAMGRALPGGQHVIDPAAIDSGVVARTVLVGRLLGAAKSPLAPLAEETICKFKQNFSQERQAIESFALRALGIIQETSPSKALAGASREVALRWIGSLWPLGPTLGSRQP